MRFAAYLILLASLCHFGGCSVVRTTADVAATSASAVGKAVDTTAMVAKTTADIGLKAASTAVVVGGASVGAGSAAISAAAATRSAAAATASVAMTGVIAVGSAVKWGVEFARQDDLEFATIAAEGANQFLSKEGARIVTHGCDDIKAHEPALLVAQRSGEFNVRAGRDEMQRICKVLTINHQSAVQ